MVPCVSDHHMPHTHTARTHHSQTTQPQSHTSPPHDANHKRAHRAQTRLKERFNTLRFRVVWFGHLFCPHSPLTTTAPLQPTTHIHTYTHCLNRTPQHPTPCELSPLTLSRTPLLALYPLYVTHFWSITQSHYSLYCDGACLGVGLDEDLQLVTTLKRLTVSHTNKADLCGWVRMGEAASARRVRERC